VNALKFCFARLASILSTLKLNRNLFRPDDVSAGDASDLEGDGKVQIFELMQTARYAFLAKRSFFSSQTLVSKWCRMQLHTRVLFARAEMV
jgi:hypothetical protein